MLIFIKVIILIKIKYHPRHLQPNVEQNDDGRNLVLSGLGQIFIS